MVEILPGKENMEKDLMNLYLVEEGKEDRLFRLYMWSELTVSIGYSQKERKFLVPVVRRPTGGGALLHGWDLSFSIADLKERWGENAGKIYREVMGRLLEVLRSFGINARMSKNRSGYADAYFCYFYPTLGEITVEGRKLVACAMRTLRRSFLLHGSIFLRMDYGIASEILGVSIDHILERVISLEELGFDSTSLLDRLSERLFKAYNLKG
ncbi:lipoyl protein ligase domain-containing protein [Thermocrinis minervae]|uniref:Lipoate-protein ligase A n=1 Tax=Thermocrinis minervae TaxID=381751 RepID=A0A1M6SQK3_9AQUI|nr:lipoate--protein ligase family protein [Thermocrinis minervae]SHK47024.1 lipoate-protein ligase A [Thermocrinis minervae]